MNPMVATNQNSIVDTQKIQRNESKHNIEENQENKQMDKNDIQ